MKKNNKKIIVLLLAMVLLLGCALGGTLAWLIADSNSVTNTFTVGNITLDVKEPSSTTIYHIIPGTEQTKDPYVEVAAGSESCWLFVKVTETNNATGATPAKYVQWDIDSTIWQPVSTATNVYYLKHTESATAETYGILLNDEVTYSSDLTKDMLDAASQPSLAFQAFAIQSEALKSGTTDVTTPEAAWALIGK